MKQKFTCSDCKKILDIKERVAVMPSFGQLCRDCLETHVKTCIQATRIEAPITRIPEIESVLIENFKVIKKADIKFSPGLNLIVGKSASGKTTILQYLVEKYNPSLMSEGEKVAFNINNVINKNCILIDDILCRLDKENLIKILKNLETCNRQVIAVVQVSQLDSIQDKIKAHIIDTKNFELKTREKK